MLETIVPHITITKHATARALERAGTNAYALWQKAVPITHEVAGQYTIVRTCCEYYAARWAWADFILVVQNATLITVIPARGYEHGEEAS